MPIYEYYCEKCQCTFEHLMLSGDESDPECPTCCGKQVKKVISAGNIRTDGVPKGKGGFGAGASCRPSGG